MNSGIVHYEKIFLDNTDTEEWSLIDYSDITSYEYTYSYGNINYRKDKLNGMLSLVVVVCMLRSIM